MSGFACSEHSTDLISIMLRPVTITLGQTANTDHYWLLAATLLQDHTVTLAFHQFKTVSEKKPLPQAGQHLNGLNGFITCGLLSQMPHINRHMMEFNPLTPTVAIWVVL